MKPLNSLLGFLLLVSACHDPTSISPDSKRPELARARRFVRTQVVVIAGDGQTGIVGTELAEEIVTQVTQRKGVREWVPAEGVRVWFATLDGGSFSPKSAITDAEGLVSTRWTIGPDLGRQKGSAFAEGVRTDFEATAHLPTRGIVVINDMNLFDEIGMQDPNNQLLARNLVNFANTGPRSDGSLVWFDRGRNSPCFSNGECSNAGNATLIMQIESAGLSVVEVLSDTMATPEVDPAVKAVFLWNPTIPFTVEEIAALQMFAGEGGRIVFIAEWDAFYGQAGIDTQNQFLADVGSQMVNIGGAVDCGYNVLPASSIVSGHQVTTGLTGLTIACGSILVPANGDMPLLLDVAGTQVLSAVTVLGNDENPSITQQLVAQGAAAVAASMDARVVGGAAVAPGSDLDASEGSGRRQD